MLFTSFVTKNGNHVVEIANRYYYFSSEGKMLSETFEERYSYLSRVCEEGKISIKRSYADFLVNEHTTRNGVDLIENHFSINDLYFFLAMEEGSHVSTYEISEKQYIIFNEVKDNIIKGFCWDHESPRGTDYDMHGECLINKKELCSIYRRHKLAAKSAKENEVVSSGGKSQRRR
jgi:hypothetical protein